MHADTVVIYTDGAARGNPGNGGYGVVLQYKGHIKELSAGFTHTTNNRMELMGVIVGLEALKVHGQQVVVYTDSSYLVNAVMKGWLSNWVKKDFKDKKNADLWKRYLKVARLHQVKLIWVKGHADNYWNNRCDELATAAADGKHLAPDVGYSIAT